MSLNHPKTWNDQPDRVTQARVICSTTIRSILIEVRKTETGQYLFSAGNLFGCQTVLCDDADAVFGLMATLNPEKTLTLPAGVVMVGEGEKQVRRTFLGRHVRAGA